MKLLNIALLLIIALLVLARAGSAHNSEDVFEDVKKFRDGNTVCYVYTHWTHVGGISCVRVKQS